MSVDDAGCMDPDPDVARERDCELGRSRWARLLLVPVIGVLGLVGSIATSFVVALPVGAQTTPTLQTLPNPVQFAFLGGPTPTVLKDSAALQGGTNPTGTITFTLFFYGIFGEVPLVDTETVSVNGNGTYSTPLGYTVPPDGRSAYQWDASYSGDSNNNPVAETNNSSEVVTVFPLRGRHELGWRPPGRAGERVGVLDRPSRRRSVQLWGRPLLGLAARTRHPRLGHRGHRG